MSLPLSNAAQISVLDQDQSNLLLLLGYHHLQHGNASHAALIFESILSFDPFNAKPSSYSSKNMYRSNSTSVEVYDWGGGHNLSNSYTGLTIFAASGNITGAISVYGYRKS
jgi:hypothetical protein